MTANVGGFDKIFRIIAGVVVIALGLIYSSWWGLLGVVFLGTGLLNFCPVYSLIKVSTNKKIPTEKIK
jgi:sulfite exporter TauE/SafE